MSVNVELARRQWAAAYDHLRRAPRGIDAGVREQIDVVTTELRRRVGSAFTLTELAVAYDDAERWTLAAIEERCPRPGWVRTASSAADAAFYLYARGASDYRP